MTNNSFKKNLVLFSKFQVTSVVATLVDYVVFVLSVEIFQIEKWLGVPFGAFAGAVVNFYVNKNFLFKSKAKVGKEVLKYFVVSSGSLILNTFIFKHFEPNFIYHYMILRILVSFSVGILWNFPLQKVWVFKGEDL